MLDEQTLMDYSKRMEKYIRQNPEKKCLDMVRELETEGYNERILMGILLIWDSFRQIHRCLCIMDSSPKSKPDNQP